MMRYLRQTILPEIGLIGQKRIADSHVTIVGAGGLGNPIAQYLAAMGVGHLTIVDGDVVSESNLNRQILFGPLDINMNKALVTKAKIQCLNPDCQIDAIDRFLTKDLGYEIFRNSDLIIDATDNFESKLLINDLCFLLKKTWIYGAVSDFEGQFAIFSADCCYRCLVPEKPRASVQNCSIAGVVGVAPGIIGNYQALEAFKYLLNNPLLPTQSGKLHVFDFRENRIQKFNISTNSKCVCHNGTILNLTDVPDIIKQHCDDTVEVYIDVREKNEVDEYFNPQMIHWPLSKLENGIFPEQYRKKSIETVCKSGVRAGLAAQLLLAQGFNNVQASDRSIYEY